MGGISKLIRMWGVQALTKCEHLAEPKMVHGRYPKLAFLMHIFTSCIFIFYLD